MTILSTLSRSSEFDKYEDILALIKQFAEEQHVYFRIHKPTIKVQCYNNQVKAEKKMDEKYIYKEVTYCCPHSVFNKLLLFSSDDTFPVDSLIEIPVEILYEKFLRI